MFETRGEEKMMQDTTIESYVKLKSENKIQPRENQILNVFRTHGNLTDRELSQALRLPINSITPRRNMLVKKDKVVKKGRKYDTVTNRHVILWGVK